MIEIHTHNSKLKIENQLHYPKKYNPKMKIADRGFEG